MRYDGINFLNTLFFLCLFFFSLEQLKAERDALAESRSAEANTMLKLQQSTEKALADATEWCRKHASSDESKVAVEASESRWSEERRLMVEQQEATAQEMATLRLKLQRLEGPLNQKAQKDQARLDEKNKKLRRRRLVLVRKGHTTPAAAVAASAAAPSGMAPLALTAHSEPALFDAPSSATAAGAEPTSSSSSSSGFFAGERRLSGWLDTMKDAASGSARASRELRKSTDKTTSTKKEKSTTGSARASKESRPMSTDKMASSLSASRTSKELRPKSADKTRSSKDSGASTTAGGSLVQQSLVAGAGKELEAVLRKRLQVQETDVLITMCAAVVCFDLCLQDTFEASIFIYEDLAFSNSAHF